MLLSPSAFNAADHWYTDKKVHEFQGQIEELLPSTTTTLP